MKKTDKKICRCIFAAVLALLLPVTVFSGCDHPPVSFAETTAESTVAETSAPETTAVLTTEAPEPPAVRFSTGLCEIGDRVFFFDSSGFGYFENGVRTQLYSGQFSGYATNGETVYYCDENGNIRCIDVATRGDEALFSIDAHTVRLLGASEDTLFIGIQQTEDDWWGMSVSEYNHKGAVVRSCAEGIGYESTEENGIMFLRDYITDAVPERVRIFDSDTGETLYDFVGERCDWGVELKDGVVYAAQVIYTDADHSCGRIELQHIDESGIRVLLSTEPTDEINTWSACLSSGVLTLVHLTEGTSTYYDAYTAEPIEPVEDYMPERDAQGRLYYTDDSLGVWRQTDDGSYCCVGTLEGEWASPAYVSGDRLYYTLDDLLTCIEVPIK